MDGKEKCEFLKKLRKEIADRNGIDYNPASCTNEEPCVGTCPVCEKEVAELMAELRKKEKSGGLINADVESLSLIPTLSLTDMDDTDKVTSSGDIIEDNEIGSIPGPGYMDDEHEPLPFIREPQEPHSSKD